MGTLYIRNVPDEVIARLKRLAEQAGASVSAVALRELADVSRRADNRSLLADLPDLAVDQAVIVAEVEAGRISR